MPSIRINANRTMTKYRQHQETIKNQKLRLKTVELAHYLHHPIDTDSSKNVSSVFEPATVNFQFNKDSSYFKSVKQETFSPQPRVSQKPLAITSGVEWNKGGYSLTSNTPNNI